MKTNSSADAEPRFKCRTCDRRCHASCRGHLPEELVCAPCIDAGCAPRPPNKWRSDDLPPCALSTFVEERVRTYVHERWTDAHLEPSERPRINIRLLSSAEKYAKVQPAVGDKLEYPPKIAYTLKALGAFLKVDADSDEEVCFFSMFVQEYPADCPIVANQRYAAGIGGRSGEKGDKRTGGRRYALCRLVYISYLESVNFFKPSWLRTDVYYQILLAYFDWVRQLGFERVYLWASPPNKGSGFIYFAHPPDMKFPTRERLQDWYRLLLNKGVETGIIDSFQVRGGPILAV